MSCCRHAWLTALVLILTAAGGTTRAPACTAPTPPTPENPEIEIEPEWEDYDSIRDRLLYKIAVEVEVASPTQLTTCQCGLGVGNSSNPAPSSFDVLAASVAVRPDTGFDEDLDAFAGFGEDASVSTTVANLPGFAAGGTAYGFSTSVDPFLPPVLNPGEHLIMAFLVEFAPADFDAVSGNLMQFAAGSTDPGHQISLFNNYQSSVVLPPYNLEPCDLNDDQECNVDDLNRLVGLGPIADGITANDQLLRYDLTGDGIINLEDVDAWLAGAADFNGLASPYKYGDANLDGVVDGQDFISWNTHKFDEALNWDEGNFNGDGFIDGVDFILWNSNKFTSSAVPEPTCFGLLSGVLIIAGALRRSRRPARHPEPGGTVFSRGLV